MRSSQILRALENPEYKSPYGPKYQYAPHIGRLNLKQLTRLGLNAGAFGAVAGMAVIFYASGIPRLQRDILQKIPYFGSFFIKETPPSDNPF